MSNSIPRGSHVIRRGQAAARLSPARTPGQRRERSGAALIVSRWAGHYDSTFTQKTYVHASDEDLQRGQAALAKIHKIA